MKEFQEKQMKYIYLLEHRLLSRVESSEEREVDCRMDGRRGLDLLLVEHLVLGGRMQAPGEEIGAGAGLGGRVRAGVEWLALRYVTREDGFKGWMVTDINEVTNEVSNGEIVDAGR